MTKKKEYKMTERQKKPKEPERSTEPRSVFWLIVIPLLIAIVGNVVGSIILWLLPSILISLTPMGALVIVIIAVYILVVILIVILCRLCPDIRPKWPFRLFMILSLIGVTLIHGLYFLPSAPTIWSFEDGTVQGWGVYDGEGNIVLSTDVTASSENAEGRYSLKVTNIEMTEKGVREKLISVNYDGDLLFNSQVTALIYVPTNATFAYGDTKFFLFDKDWGWRQSGVWEDDAQVGAGLKRGKWIKVSWDLSSDEAQSWPRPWKGMLGIKIRIEEKEGEDFIWPVYIDNVTITVPK